MVPLLVILTILVFVVADVLIQWARARRGSVSVPLPVRGVTAAELLLPDLQPERFALPGGLLFHRSHIWLNLLYSGQVKVGVDDFLQKLLGRIDAITLPPLGVQLKAGEPFIALRQGHRTFTLPAPVDGVVCAVNGEAAKFPTLVKRDPYTRGWLVALQPLDLTVHLPRLVVGQKALDWLKTELGSLKTFLDETLSAHRDAVVGLTAADGGLVADGLLEHLDDQTWAAFDERFLKVR
jgi:glycine cleavage system H lipoate-binding protein